MSERDIKLQKAWMIGCLIEAYRKIEPAGGHLHLVIDDFNFSSRTVQHCLSMAVEAGDYWAEQIARLLLDFKWNERQMIVCNPGKLMTQMLTVDKSLDTSELDEHFKKTGRYQMLQETPERHFVKIKEEG